MGTQPLESIDVSDLPELLNVAEKVRSDAKPRVLRRGEQALAVISPFIPAEDAEAPKPEKRRGRRRREVTQDDVDAFWSAVGGWRDNVDVDQFLKDNEESRRISIRRPVEL